MCVKTLLFPYNLKKPITRHQSNLFSPATEVSIVWIHLQEGPFSSIWEPLMALDHKTKSGTNLENWIAPSKCSNYCVWSV